MRRRDTGQTCRCIAPRDRTAPPTRGRQHLRERIGPAGRPSNCRRRSPGYRTGPPTTGTRSQEAAARIRRSRSRRSRPVRRCPASGDAADVAARATVVGVRQNADLAAVCRQAVAIPEPRVAGDRARACLRVAGSRPVRRRADDGIIRPCTRPTDRYRSACRRCRRRTTPSPLLGLEHPRCRHRTCPPCARSAPRRRPGSRPRRSRLAGVGLRAASPSLQAVPSGFGGLTQVPVDRSQTPDRGIDPARSTARRASACMPGSVANLAAVARVAVVTGNAAALKVDAPACGIAAVDDTGAVAVADDRRAAHTLPGLHASPLVHALPSLQEAPFGFSGLVQAPVAGLHHRPLALIHRGADDSVTSNVGPALAGVRLRTGVAVVARRAVDFVGIGARLGRWVADADVMALIRGGTRRDAYASACDLARWTGRAATRVPRTTHDADEAVAAGLVPFAGVAGPSARRRGADDRLAAEDAAGERDRARQEAAATPAARQRARDLIES